MKERLERMRKKLIETVPHICVERAKIVTECYKKNERLPFIEKRAFSLKTVLREMSIYIDDGELIVGNQASSPRAAPVYPEYAFEFVLKELDEFEHRESDRFVVSEKNKARLREILPWWEGKTLRDRAIAIQSAEVLEDKTIGVLGWDGNVSSGEGHIIPDYEMVLKLGFPGMLKRVEGLLSGLNLTEPDDLNKLSFYRACKMVLEGCIDYIKRFENLAKEMASANEQSELQEELEKIARRCHALTERAPATFFEALQCVWFVQVILHIESNGHSLSMGRLDQYLYPFFTKDIQEDTVTEDEIREILGCFYLKVFGNNKLRSWGTTQTQLGYPTYQNICLGGQTSDGNDASNEFSNICVEMLGEIRLPEPNVYIRLHKDTPEEFLLKAIKVVKMGFGIPSFVNDQVIIPALMRRGVSKKDAYNFSTMGCTEVQVPGKWGYRANGKSKVNLLRILEIVINGGVDHKSGKVVIKGLRPLEECTSIDELKEGYHIALRHYMRLHVIADNINEMAMTEMVPDAFCSLLMQDCLGRGKAIKDGGTVYDIISGTLVGIPNVGNSLFAIKKIVFDEKLITPAELKAALDSNFDGKQGEYIRNLLVNRAEKYGNDFDEVDELTRETADYFADEIYKYKTMRSGKGPLGCCYTSSTVTITANISCGASVGATPDGRRAGEPTTEGVSPSRGTLTNGLTSMFKSVGKLSTELFMGGQLLNVRINPATVQTPEEEQKFVALLRAAGELNCWHSQYNVLSDETLRDAQKHPENYTDLIVRVAGYSALFTSLNRELQEDIISRTLFNL